MSGLRKLLIKIIASILFITTAAASRVSVQAAGDSEVSGSNWMSGIANERYLYEINIPGTQDSAMRIASKAYEVLGGAEYTVMTDTSRANSQSLNLSTQLKYGVRFFDIGLSSVNYRDQQTEENKDKLWVSESLRDGASNVYCYGITPKNSADPQKEPLLKLDDVLNEIKTFLSTQGSEDETVILWLKPEMIRAADQADIRINGLLSDAAYSSLIYTGASLPKLKDCRGKIVLLSSFVDSEGNSLINNSFAVNPPGANGEFAIGGTPFSIGGLAFDKTEPEEMISPLKLYAEDRKSLEYRLPDQNENSLTTGSLILSGKVESSAYAGSREDLAKKNVNKLLYTDYEALFKQRGWHYGWVLSDYVDQNGIEMLWKDNFLIDYTITFRKNHNGTGSDAPEPLTVRCNRTAAKPEEEMTRSGYTFRGWYTESACSEGSLFNFDSPVTKNTTLYAGWTKNWTVTFNWNYGSVTSQQSVPPDALAVKPADPTREGCIFAGWYKDQACSEGNEYLFDTPVKENLTLYAKWKAEVTFDSKGGSAVESKTVRTGEKIEKPSDPVKANLIFDGWYTNPTLTSTFNFNNTPVNKGMTLYAKWNALISFEANGGKNSMQVKTVPEGTQYTLPSCSFTPPAGKVFDAWEYQGSSYAPGSKITITGATTLRALWKSNGRSDSGSGSGSGSGSNSGSNSGTDNTDYTASFTVDFYTNGGSAVESQTIPYGKAVVRPQDPVRQGYSFEGWFTDSTLTAGYYFASPVTENLTLYAKWSSTDQCTVSFNAGGGSGYMAGVRVSKGSEYVLPGCNFTPPEGKSFYTWDRGETGTVITVNSDIVLYARWRNGAGDQAIPSVTITFYTNGGTLIEDQTILQGLLPAEPPAPVREGYTFGGWYYDMGSYEGL